MRRLIRFCFLCLIAFSGVCAPLGAHAQTVAHDIPLVVETPQYVLDSAGLTVPGYGPDTVPGAPELPVWTTVVEVPAGAAWAIEEVGSEAHVLHAPVPLPPAPTTTLRLDGPLSNFTQDQIADALTVERRPDPAVYGNNSLYPSQVVQAGPEGTANGKRLLPLKVYPFQYNPVTRLLLYRPRIQFTVHFEVQPGGTAPLAAVASTPSGQASEPGLRILTGERGLYRLTYTDLSAAGAAVATLNPADLAVWYLGQPVDIEVSGAEDGRFDPGDEIVFYAEPYAGRYMTQNVYRLTWSAGASPRMANRDASPTLSQPPLTVMRQRAHVEYDRVYYSTYTDLARDADHFFDNPLYVLTGVPTSAVTYTFTLANVVQSGAAELKVSAHGGLSVPERDPDQALLLRINGGDLGPYQWDGSVTHTVTAPIPASSLVPGPNTLTLVADLAQLPGIDKYWVSPDWAEITYPAQMLAKDNRLFAEAIIGADAAPAVDAEASGFTAPGVRAYDVTNPRHPVRLAGVRETNIGANFHAVFAAKPNASFSLATGDGLQLPAAIQYDTPSSLSTPNNGADYIAIVHRSLWDAVQPLLDHRAAEGLRAAKVDVQDIYDEFSGGRVDPEAIRAFLTYAYHHWNPGGPRPAYVLLVGDGHFDFKGALRPDLPNLIPPYLIDVDPFIGETAADNRYVSVDGDSDFLPDMAIGRIPAKSPADVTAVVDKILSYETSAPAGSWQKRAVFVADNKADSAGNFHTMSEEARSVVPPSFDAQTIYYKSSTALDTAAKMKTAIRSALDGGALYLQWFGHAAKTFWGKDKIWELSDPSKLANNTVWPFTAGFSCWAGYFINVQPAGQYGNSEQSLAEAMLLPAKKSSLADFSPSGLHVGSELVALNKGLTEALFVRHVDRVGPAVNGAKLAYFAGGGGALDLIDTQVLFGDPATKLSLPPRSTYLPLIRR